MDVIEVLDNLMDMKEWEYAMSQLEIADPEKLKCIKDELDDVVQMLSGNKDDSKDNKDESLMKATKPKVDMTTYILARTNKKK
jgi:hypothetical protein